MTAASSSAAVVVVGGGAAGCVVAARLAEDPGRSVILLEAGPDLRDNVPDGLRGGLRLSREHGWGYESEPDERGTVEPLHRVRLLGGTVRLRSADPSAAPRIELPGLREESDVDRLIEGFRRALEVADHPEARRHCAAPASPRPSNPAEERRIVRENAYSIPHVVGTCAMGPSADEGAVVDASGRVHGTNNLSVIDASIIPEPPSGFPHVITIMLAEKLAARIQA